MIKEIKKEDILNYIKVCKKEGLSFNKKKDVIYYGYYKDNILVGFVGVMYYRNKAICKNDFVLPEYRNKGIYSELNEYRMQKINENDIHRIEGSFTDRALPLHLKNGARIVKKYKICTKVIYENI